MTNDAQNQPNPAIKYFCEKCDYHTSKKNNLTQHLLTVKHCATQNDDLNDDKTSLIQPNPAKALSVPFECGCGKKYKHRQGLHVHKKAGTCVTKINKNDNNASDNTHSDQQQSIDLCANNDTKQSVIALVKQNLEIIKQNNEFKELIIEQNKQMINLTNKPNVTNNQFNLNFFLNERCKDALNMTEFLNTITIQLNDLENSLELGYSDGLSKIIVTGLNALELCKRPIHCSDLKRETLYIKDGDIWEKDNEDRKKIKNAINSIERKTLRKLADWPKTYPNSLVGSHIDNTTYMKIVRQVSGGDLDKSESNINKIIKNIAQGVQIDKTA